MEVAVHDIFLSQPGRLDDRTRAAVLRLAEATVDAVEQRIAGLAARTLNERDQREAAAVLESNRSLAWPRLLGAGLMRDAEMIAALIAQARIDLLDDSLTTLRAHDAGPTVVVSLVEHADAGWSNAAVRYLVADSLRRLAAGERDAMLPAPLRSRLTWWVAAALRERLGALGGAEADRALSEAALRCLEDDHSSDGIESAAIRLAVLLGAVPGQRGDWMLRAMESARSTLFVALLAEALGTDFCEARGMLLDSESERLWLALRAAGLPRDAIARIGFLLSEADPARDLPALIEWLDPLAALDPVVAQEALAELRLPRDFRAAVRTLTRPSCP